MLQQLQQENIEVAYFWKKDGKGYFPLENLNINLTDFLNYPKTSCAQQSYLFARKALQNGFLARRVGLWASDGTNDVMVEVRIKNKWYLFVPTAGVYYRFSLAEILSHPEKGNLYQGKAKGITEMYLSPTFFSNIYQVDMYQTLNEFEFNYASLANVSSENLFPHPNSGEAVIDNDFTTYGAGKENLYPQTIELSWQKPISMYRFFIKWLSLEDYATDYDIVISYQKKVKAKYHIKPSESQYKYGDYSQISFPELLTTDNIKLIVNKAHGKPRLLIKEILIY